MRSIRARWAAAAVGVGALAVIASAQAGEQKKWTAGTTEAANEVVGARSGLSFHLADPPGERPVLHVTAVPRPSLLQELDLSLVDPPEPDREALDPVARIQLVDPPDPDRPVIVIRVLHPEDVILLGPTGEPVLVGGR